MKLLVVALVALSSAACLVEALPRYIAIPLEDVELVPVSRVPRAAVAPAPASAFGEEQVAQEARFQRQAGGGGDHHGDYVDYGAHTGHHGAFGWYADFPVHAAGH